MKKFPILKNLLWNLLALLVFGVLLWWLLDKFLDSYTLHGEKIEVPQLQGLRYDEAVNLLKENDLRVEIMDTIYKEDANPGIILMSNPEAGHHVKKQRTIYLTINAAQVPKVSMPDLTDKNIKQAEIILQSLGLTIGSITTKPNIAEDAVLEQLYKGKPVSPNTEIERGSVIDLVIGDGAYGDLEQEEHELPDLVDYSFDNAKLLLEAKELRLGEISSEGKIIDSSKAVIVGQIPEYEPGKKILSGEKIDIKIKQR